MEKLNSNLNYKQLFVYFALIAPVAKLIIMPSSYFYFAGKDSYVGILIQGLFDLFTLFSILYVIKNDGRSFFEIMSGLIGKIPSNIIAAFYSIFFLLKAFLPLVEILLLSITVLYSNVSKFVIYLPIFITLFYSVIIGFNGQFRSIELIAPFVLLSFIGIALLSFSSFDIIELLPSFEFGFSVVGKSITSHISWFGDFIIMTLLMNNVKRDKGLFRLGIGYSIGVLITTIIFLLISGVFGYTSPRQIFLITKLSKYSIAFSNLGRIDFLFILVIFSAILINVCIYLTAAVKSLNYIIRVKPLYISLVFVALLCFPSIFYIKQSGDIFKLYKTYFTPYIAVFQYAIPTLLPIISHFSLKRRGYEQRQPI